MVPATERTASMQVLVREAHADDLVPWIALRDGLDPTAPEAVARAKVLVADPERVAFVADAGGDVVGLLSVLLQQRWHRCPRGGPVAFLDELYVVPGWRGRGIATALRDAAAAWARERGARCLSSQADLADLDSQGWHRAIGFEELERIVTFCQPLAAGEPRCN